MDFWIKNSPNKGPFFGRFSLNIGGFPDIGKIFSKMGSFPPKFIIKVGMTATVGNYRQRSENREADPRPFVSHAPPGAPLSGPKNRTNISLPFSFSFDEETVLSLPKTLKGVQRPAFFARSQRLTLHSFQNN